MRDRGRWIARRSIARAKSAYLRFSQLVCCTKRRPHFRMKQEKTEFQVFQGTRSVFNKFCCVVQKVTQIIDFDDFTCFFRCTRVMLCREVLGSCVYVAKVATPAENRGICPGCSLAVTTVHPRMVDEATGKYWHRPCFDQKDKVWIFDDVLV